MKLNNEINPDLEVKDFLVDKSFLKLLKIYFRRLDIDKLDFIEEIKIFIKKLDETNLNKNKIYFSIEEIFENLGYIFSNSEALWKFLLFLDNYPIDPELKSVFSLIWDYLISTYKNKSDYANELLYTSDHLKEKVAKIVENREFDNPIFRLKETGFPIISSEGEFLDSINLKDSIDISWNGNPYEIYVKVKDMAWKSFYQNINGQTLKTEEKTVWEWENSFTFNELTIQDDAWERTIIFDKDFNRITLYDLVEFLNNWEKTLINSFSYAELRFKETFLSKIIDIYDFNWIKFVKFSTDAFNIEENTFIIRSDWLFLRDTEYKKTSDSDKEIKYIKSLFNAQDILWMQFIEFTYLDYSFFEKELISDLFSIDWLIDMNWKVIYIKWEPLIKIEEIQFKDYYKINDRNNFILSKYQILAELKWYVFFNSQDKLIELGEYDEENLIAESPESFSLWFSDDEKIYIEDGLRERIIWKWNNSGEVDLYLEYSGNENKIEYEDLVSLIKVNCRESEILEWLDFKIERINSLN